MDNVFLADTALFKRAAGRSQTADANSMLYLNKANALFDISHGFETYEAALQSIKAKVLMVGADTDILFTATQLKQHFDAFQKAGLDVSFFELKTGFGHLGGVLDISQASETITEFLGE
jgi:homoserine O-acetyltransferase